MEIGELFTAGRHNKGSEMQVCDEFNNPLDLFITIAGADSDVWQQANRDRQSRMFSRIAAQEDDDTDYDLNDLVAASLGWRGAEQDGEALEFSKTGVRQLYVQAPYIRDQITLWVHSRANFTKS